MKKALFIGIDYFSTPQSRLNGCIDDIVNVRNFLIDAYGYELSNMVLLRDDNLEMMPTRKNILDSITKIVKDSSECSEIWLHYSGHGSQILERDSPLKSAIVPSDYLTDGIIIDHDLYEILKDTKCRTILMFDSCYSGSVVDLPWSFEYNPSTPNTFITTHINDHVLSNTEIYMFSGSKDTQTSVDTYSFDLTEYVGAFTNAFLHCVRENRHEVDLLKLYSDIWIYLNKQGYSQNPIFSSSVSDPKHMLIREGSRILSDSCKTI
jgi:hypothetical protein